MRDGAKPNRARQLRADQTAVERILWFQLRNRRLIGLKFRRQVPIGPFIVDFACVDRKLIVELDGGQHAETIVGDERRTTWLEKHGWRVLRFWNNDVTDNLNGVLQRITAATAHAGSSPHPGPLPHAGEGETTELR